MLFNPLPLSFQPHATILMLLERRETRNTPSGIASRVPNSSYTLNTPPAPTYHYVMYLGRYISATVKNNLKAERIVKYYALDFSPPP